MTDFEFEPTVNKSSKLGERLSKHKNKVQKYILYNNRRIPITDKLTVGRNSDNDIVVDDKMVSRYHAVIQKIKEEFYIKDLDSANGTFVNRKKVPPQKYVLLKKGEKIVVGKSELAFRIK